MEAERVTVELLAKVDGFDSKIRGSANSFGGSMKVIEQSADRAERKVGTAMVTTERSMARAAQQSRLLGYQIGDIGQQLAGGQSPFLILAQQGPQVANALDGAKGAVGRFAAFLSGPWGAALLAATTVLGAMASKLIDFGDEVDGAVDKLKKQAKEQENADKAADQFGNTIEGVTQALRDNREALDALNLVQKTSAEEAYDAAEAQRVKAIRIRETTVALLAQAQAEYEASRSQNFGAAGGAGAGMAQAIYATRVSNLETLLKTAEEQLAIAKGQTAEARANLIVEQATASEADKINQKYDKQIDLAKQRALAEGTVEKMLRKQVDAIEAQREADLKRLRDTEREKRKTRTNNEVTSPFISPVQGGSLSGSYGEKRGKRNHGGVDLAVPVGTKVSASAAGTVITAGKLPGYGNVVIVDHGGGTTTRYAHLSSVLARKGDSVGQGEVIGLSGGAKGAPGSGNSRGPHLHYEVRQGGRTVDPTKGAYRTDGVAVAAKAAEAAERAAEQELRRREQFENELASLQMDELEARQSLITSAEEIAAIEMQAIEISRQRYNDNLDALVEQGKLTDKEAEELRGINEERAKLRAELIKTREDERKFRVAESDRRRATDYKLAQIQAEAEILEGQADLARTQAERRVLETRLLDLQFQAERIQNDTIIAAAERLRLSGVATEEQQKIADALAAEAELYNSTLEQRRGQAQQGVNQSTQGPLEGYFDSIPSDMAEINEALEAVAAGGLATFTDALTDALVNFKSLKDVGLATLQSITGALVRMAIQQVILRTIGKTLGQGAVAATSAQAAAAGAAWATPAALASLATLGANAGPATAAIAGTTALAQGLAAAGLGRAEGGPIFGPGGPRSDVIPIAASRGEYMIRAASAAKLGRGTLDFLNRNGELPAFADGGPITMLRPVNSRVEGQRTSSGISEQALRRIETAVERGAAAQAPVQLYPTLDPASAMERMLSNPLAQRKFFDFVGENSGKFNSQLNR